jgi:hypothetical protein
METPMEVSAEANSITEVSQNNQAAWLQVFNNGRFGRF